MAVATLFWGFDRGWATRVLPTNTWLSRIRFTESTVEIEGYAASATEILPKLREPRDLMVKLKVSGLTGGI